MSRLERHARRALGLIEGWRAERALHIPGEQSLWSCPVPAFCFDIDGVLVKGRRVLDAARSALTRLYSENGQNPLYPVCFLTNGGGVLEAKKAHQLSEWLQVDVKEDQVILSHTPFKSLLPRLAETPVLISGRHDIQSVAASYGFQQTVTVDQLARAYPRAVPNYPPLQSGSSEFKTSLGSDKAPIKAVLVFSDPANWYLDLQLITDVVTSGGVVGGPRPSHGTEPIELVFSNPDKLFSNDFPTPRFGQGAFQVALRAVLDQVAENPPFKWRTFGKPNPEPYELAMVSLSQQAKKLSTRDAPSTPSHIYMVGEDRSSSSKDSEASHTSGLPKANSFKSEADQDQLLVPSFTFCADNPDADMAGARNAGPPWQSILVRTGVFDGSTPNSLGHPADIVVDDVKAAVDAALHRHRAKLWHSMR